MAAFDLGDLEAILLARADALPTESYTARLLDRGMDKCAQKLGEEACELVIEAVAGNKKAVIEETADLLYHLLVVLIGRDIPLSRVYEELETRSRQSGLAEKAGRSQTRKGRKQM